MKVFVYVIVVVAALFLAAFVLFVLFGSLPAAPPRVVEGEGRMRVVELKPMGLTIKRGDGSWLVCEDFELRMSEEAGAKSLLIRGRDLVGDSEYGKGADGRAVVTKPARYKFSDSTYAVSLDGSFAQRKVDDDTWERARRFGPDELDSEYNSSARRFFIYEGKTLPSEGATKSGLLIKSFALAGAETDHWLLSRDGSYVAGFSHTSRRRSSRKPSLMPFIGGDDGIADGTMYVDIFDGATGKRLALAAKGHRGSYEMHVFRQATWVDGRYFVMPLNGVFDSWLVGVMPE